MSSEAPKHLSPPKPAYMRGADPETAEPDRMVKVLRTVEPAKTAPAIAEIRVAIAGVAIPIIRPVVVIGPTFGIVLTRRRDTAGARRRDRTRRADLSRFARGGRRSAQHGRWRKLGGGARWGSRWYRNDFGARRDRRGQSQDEGKCGYRQDGVAHIGALYARGRELASGRLANSRWKLVSTVQPAVSTTASALA